MENTYSLKLGSFRAWFRFALGLTLAVALLCKLAVAYPHTYLRPDSYSLNRARAVIGGWWADRKRPDPYQEMRRWYAPAPAAPAAASRSSNCSSSY